LFVRTVFSDDTFSLNSASFVTSLNSSILNYK
jgi:hypothetical protein